MEFRLLLHKGQSTYREMMADFAIVKRKFNEISEQAEEELAKQIQENDEKEVEKRLFIANSRMKIDKMDKEIFNMENKKRVNFAKLLNL